MSYIKKPKPIFIGSHIMNFKKTIDISMKLLGRVKKDKFISPYSVIPLISQMLGLNTPLIGTGDSPYSITSIIFDMYDQTQLFRKIFGIPLIEKRKIIDEIYDMLAPALLGE